MATKPFDLLWIVSTKQTQPLWTWDSLLQRYRVTSEGSKLTKQRSGTIIGQKKMVELRDTFLNYQKQRVELLAEQLVDGKITRRQFVLGMREAIRETWVTEYVLAKGGRLQMTQSDYGWIGAKVKEQYNKYLYNFEKSLKAGEYRGENLDAVLKRIQDRASLYIDSTIEAFSQGRMKSMGIDKLPNMPPKHVKCGCWWRFSVEEDGIYASWIMNEELQNCPICTALAKKYKNYKVKNENTR